jgi:hypothetical protein
MPRRRAASWQRAASLYDPPIHLLLKHPGPRRTLRWDASYFS